MSVNHSIQIPDQMFVAFVRSNQDGYVHKGYTIPYGTDSASKKRQLNLRHSTHADREGGLEPVVLENKPMYGFKISRKLRANGWRSDIQTVSIEDPRGFEFEVSVANLIMLTDSNLIHNGEIIQQCVWARDGAINILLPINSQPYLDAVVNTERVSKRVNTRSVKPGNKVLLHDGIKGVYMGSMYTIMRDYNRNLSISQKKKHIVRVEGDSGTSVEYHGYPTMKISEVLDSTPQTKEALSQQLVNDIKDKTVTFRKVTSGYGHVSTLTYGDTLIFAKKERRSISYDEAMKAKSNSSILGVYDDECYLIEGNSMDPNYRSYYYRSLGVDEVQAVKINVFALDKGTIEIVQEYNINSSSYYRSREQKTYQINKDEIDYFVLELTLKDSETNVNFHVNDLK